MKHPLLLLSLLLAAASLASAARAADKAQPFAALSSLLSAEGDLQRCAATSLSQTQNFTRGLSGTATCLKESAKARLIARADGIIASTLNRGYRRLNKTGQAKLGEGFHIDSSLAYSLAADHGLQGNLDAIIPLHAFTGSVGTTGAIFLQNGITRYQDAQGAQRSDLRTGLVHRLALGANKNNLFGWFALLQQNLESGHERLATGMDYTGVWGTGSLTYFKPKTGWRLARSGFQERPLEGAELKVRLKPTTTIAFHAAFGHWQDKQGQDAWLTRGRLGIQWQPHSYLSLAANWHGIGTQTHNPAIRITIRRPLGGPPGKRKHWQGLGRQADKTRHLQAKDIWRAVANVNRIEYSERRITTVGASNKELAALASVRFLQERVTSGKTLTLEISLPDAVPADVLLVIAFRPGQNQPAIAGIDYIDEPVEVLIRQGEHQATATIQLPYNADLSAGRTLKALVISATLQG